MQRTVVAMAMVTALGGCAWFGSGSAPKPMDLGPNVVNLPVRQAWTVRIPAIKDANVRAQVQGQDVIVAAADGTVVSINASNGRESWRGQAGKALQTGVGADGRHAAVVTTGNYDWMWWADAVLAVLAAVVNLPIQEAAPAPKHAAAA